MIEQRTNEWLEMKRGKFSASDIYKLCGSRGLGQTGMSYIYEKGAEILTGIKKEIPVTFAMEWGNMYEDIASEYYASVFNKKESDFLVKDGFKQYSEFSGCSPDRLIICSMSINFVSSCRLHLKNWCNEFLMFLMV